MEPIKGLVAATFAPLSPKGEVQTAVLPRYADHLVRSGVAGVFVNGTTGEGQSLTMAERHRIAEGWRRVIADGNLPLKLIVHVGHLCLKDARELAAQAEGIGADAIAAIAPFFFKPQSVEEAADWCARVASAAPNTPFLYYHIPVLTGVSLPMADFLPVASARIPTFAGLKFTNEDLADFSETLRLSAGKHSIFFGRDEILLSALRLGAASAVGSTYNYAAPLYRRVMAAYAAGDEETAEREQQRSPSFIRVMSKYGMIPAAKATMAFIGVDCGPVLPPLRPLPPSGEKTLRADLTDIGFFDWIRCWSGSSSAAMTRSIRHGPMWRSPPREPWSACLASVRTMATAPIPALC
jgi:N-acetylneuraminate lyase